MSRSSDGNENADEWNPSLRASISVVIEESSQVGGARRAAGALAHALGFPETEQGNLAIVVTEAANNIVRHAGRGEILLRTVEADSGGGGVEVLSVDKGPGMRNVAQCLEDGFSTAGTPGNGLGAIRRLSSAFDIYSRPGQGTALLSYVWGRSAEVTVPQAAGVVNRPKPGEEACGDSWAADGDRGGRQTFLLVDGLGHGEEAARVAQMAVNAFRTHCRSCPPQEILQKIHAALRGTRGAAVAVAQTDPDARAICFAGVGNIAGAILAGGVSTSMMSHHGIVGYQVRKFQEFLYPCPPDSVLLMHSDGISAPGTLSAYPGLESANTALAAGVAYRDHQRQGDDATVLVARIGGREVLS